MNMLQSFVFAAIFCVAFGQKASLVASKEPVNKIAVVEENIVFKYSVYNVGDGDAQDVTLEDQSFASEHFTVVEGLTKVQFDTLPAGGNVTHNVVVKVSSSGYYNISGCTVTYNDGETEEKISASNRIIQMPVLPSEDHARMYTSHVAEWLIFLAIGGFLVLTPIFLYQQAKPSELSSSKSKKE